MIGRWRTRAGSASAVILALLLLAAGLWLTFRLDTDYRRERHEVAQSRAEVLAASVGAALDFGDRETAREMVSALGVSREVRAAAVYGADKRLFAGFARPGVDTPAAFAAAPAGGDEAVGMAPVERAGQRIGTVVVRSELDPSSRRIGRYALVALLAAMASLIVAILARSQQALRRANADLAAANSELLSQIAERERAEAQLRQIQRMESIGQLTGGIAHDFNNMLAIVIGSLDMAKRRFDRPERVHAAIDGALEGAHRAAKLTQRLLAFARRQPLQPQPIEANTLVQNMSELLRRTLGEGIAIETVLSGGLWRTSADPSELENAILNLCVNARDAMEGAGRLTIETANAELDQGYAETHPEVVPGAYVVICVTDTGPGMPPEVIDRAFEPFFTTKGAGKGTGLGLSQVYGFVRQSGGHVGIYSEMGVGTTVKIYLPRYLGEGASARPAELQGGTPRAQPGEVILVVEDEDRVRRVSAESLRELGYTVLEAPRAEIALQLLGERPEITLLLTDIVMPEVDGRQLADRALVLRPDLPIVFMTGYTRNAIIHNGVVDAGINLLPKPFTMEQLARKLRAVLDECAAQRAGHATAGN